MKYFGEGLSEKHKELNKIIRKADMIEEAKKLFLEIHALVHVSDVSGGTANEVDALLDDLTRPEYAVMPTSKDETIAWALWHIARIEDLTMNVLVDNAEQIFNEEWQRKMNADICHTGNSMTDDEIIRFSKSVDTDGLLAYRRAVGKRTREIAAGLTGQRMKCGVSPDGTDKIRREGGVAKEDEWLLDFWGKKDIAGLLLMPPTRHVIVHLNACCKWKLAIRIKTSFYMA